MPSDKDSQNKTTIPNKPIVLATKKSRFSEIITQYFVPTPETLIYHNKYYVIV